MTRKIIASQLRFDRSVSLPISTPLPYVFVQQDVSFLLPWGRLRWH